MSCQSVTLIVLCIFSGIMGLASAITGGATSNVIAGVLSILLALLGLYGVVKRNKTALYVFAVFFFIIALAKIIIGGLALAVIPHLPQDEDPERLRETEDVLKIAGGLSIADGILAFITGVLAVMVAKEIQNDGRVADHTI